MGNVWGDKTYFRTGGIEILAQKGKIKVDNTLEARLEMISQQILPSIRGKLFGSNPNRSTSLPLNICITISFYLILGSSLIKMDPRIGKFAQFLSWASFCNH